MANREENLKKIDDRLEKLDDEQLEMVAGGIASWLSCYGEGDETDPTMPRGYCDQG